MRTYAVDYEFGEARQIALRLPDCLNVVRFPNTQPAGATEQHLAEVHSIFRKWLGQSYDTEVLDTVLAAAAGHLLPGDPAWVLVVGGSGATKSETVTTLAHIDRIPVHMLGSITSAGALLTGLGKKDRDDSSSGGLLREIPNEAVVVFKDFTSIISLGKEARNSVLAAFREIYDGSWGRSTGGGGGRTEEWKGRWIVIAAVTTAIDTTERDVSSKMGDRFALIRMRESKQLRFEAGRMSSANQGNEIQMRKELAASVRVLFRHVRVENVPHMKPRECEILLSVVDVVTRARSGVEYSYSGADVVYAHAPEAPTRLNKQLMQLWRGAVAIGHSRATATWLCLRVAFDSMPPMRLVILKHLAEYGAQTQTDIAKHIQKPETSIRRELQALHHLGVLSMEPWKDLGKGGRHAHVYELSDEAVTPLARSLLLM